MNAYQFFCEIPGLEITEDHSTFEGAFRAQHQYTDMVMDQVPNFDLLDLNMGIVERGIRILAPKAMERARNSGLMDQILTEESGSVMAAFNELIDNNLPAEFSPVVHQDDTELVPA